MLFFLRILWYNRRIMDKEDFYSLLKAVPKAELHLHEEAVISRRTIAKLYQENLNTKISNGDLVSLFSYNDLPGFLDCFIKIQKLFTKIDDLRYISYDLCNYLIDNNVTYCETFFSPTSHLKKGWTFDDMSEILKDGIEVIKEKTGITVRIIVDVSRTFGIENAQHNLDLLLKANNPYILGIGLGGNEETGPAKMYTSVFENARKAGLEVVAHAGETVDSSSIKDAINYLGVKRIGHGITAAYDQEFIKELAKSKVPLEISPTSNVFTKKYITDIRNHPIKKLYDAGVMVTLNTDDPVFFKVSLLDEYWNIYSNLNFSLDEIKQVIKNGFKAAFIPEEEKTRYYNLVDKKWSEWFAKHPQAN